MANRPSYVDIISEYSPNIMVASSGADDDYNALVAVNGDVLPTKEELDVKALYMSRKAVWEEIKARRDYRKAAGIKINGNWFHSDDPSRIQQIALVMFGANMPPGILWKTMQGTFVPMTPELAMAIFQANATSDQIVFAKAEQHRQLMIVSEEPINYDYTTGWPMIYEESPEHALLVGGGYQ